MDCEHSWGEEPDATAPDNTSHKADIGPRNAKGDAFRNSQRFVSQGGFSGGGQFCRHCQAWLGSLGLEPTPELYIEHMVEVFREVWRVLRRDGTCWVNMGDSYAHSGACGGSSPDGPRKPRATDAAAQRKMKYRVPPGLKPKDLCGMPWRLAFALRADGWWLRSEIIWHKPNPMPESVRDRPMKAHETVFLLTKAARYFYDCDAIREKQTTADQDFAGRTPPPNKGRIGNYLGERAASLTEGGWIPNAGYNPAGRNKRTVWTIPTSPFPGSHFATFPPKLIEPMILTSPTKCCAVCGRGWERVTERAYNDQHISESEKYNQKLNALGTNVTFGRGHANVTTLGFRPACECPGLDGDAPWQDCAAHPDGEANWPSKPAVVLDPFVGSGTTIMVALRHGRNAIGFELSETYADMARRRIVGDSPLWNRNGG